MKRRKDGRSVKSASSRHRQQLRVDTLMGRVACPLMRFPQNFAPCDSRWHINMQAESSDYITEVERQTEVYGVEALCNCDYLLKTFESKRSSTSKTCAKKSANMGHPQFQSVFCDSVGHCCSVI
eukprot:2069262-Amphidinium_carterae.1